MHARSDMNETERLRQENTALRRRLTGLSEAMLRINESLDYDSVFDEVAEAARAITAARFSGITVWDEAGNLEMFASAGLTPDERQYFIDLPINVDIRTVFHHLDGPTRVHDVVDFVRSLGLPQFHPPVEIGPALIGPIRNQGTHVGVIHMARGPGEDDFNPEDEETLQMFSSQAALAIEKARRYSDEQRARTDMETLIDTSPVGVVVLDADTGAPFWVNREAQRLAEHLMQATGSLERLFQVMTFRRADGQTYSLVEVPLAYFLQSGSVVRAEEIVLSVPGAGSVTVLVNATPIRSNEGKVGSVVVTLQDMTPVEEQERMRAEFLGMVSHELRAPLSAIRGSAATLLEELPAMDPVEVQQFHRIILAQSERMRVLISDLLDATRIETGSLSVDPSPVEVSALVEEARSAFLTGYGGSELVVSLPPGLPLVMADRRRVIQVISNLLSNAANHSLESARVTITAALDGDLVAIAVTDQGAGIPVETLPYLFRKYYRVEGEDRDSYQAGSGLGLAICKGLVEAHGGRIWAESDGPGQGARFTFTLPVAHNPAEGHVALAGLRPAPDSLSARQSQPRVLVVDDDPQTLRYVRDILIRSGYFPIITAFPNEARRLVLDEKPDLALLDMLFPGTDGIELMQEIRELVDLPVIFLSAYGQEDIIVRAFNSGAADYVSKPFSPTELNARIRAALRKWKQAAPEAREPFLLGDLKIDYRDRRVTLAGREVHLTPTEYDLLCELSYHPGGALTHNHLLTRVWGLDRSGAVATVRTYVKRLRRKLGDPAESPTYIHSEPRVGYRLG